jgi:hypothetical protein
MMRLQVFCVIGIFLFQSGALAQDAPGTAGAGKATLRVITTPAHARIYINEGYVGTSPLSAKVSVPGDYFVEARLSGQTTSAQISLAGETPAEVNMVFSPQPFNILALVILLVLTAVGMIVLGRVTSREVMYSSAKNKPRRK